MDARTKTFMLLPDFHFVPSEDIALGRVLPLNDDTKLPDPDEPLSARMSIADSRITEQSLRAFDFDGDTTKITSGGLNADLSLLTGVGVGVDVTYMTLTGLKVSSDLVVKTRFRPSKAEMAKLLSEPLISSILKLRSRPPLYLITGLMVAHGAKIHDSNERHRGERAHANADLTALQVPLNLGINGEKDTITNNGSITMIEGELILAYQLVRMQKKLFGKPKHQIERKWALFDDTEPVNESLSIDDYDLEYVDDVDGGASKLF